MPNSIEHHIIKDHEFTESRLRSFAKAFSWRMIESLCLIFVLTLAIGHHEITVYIGLADFILKLSLYYIHERAWLRVPFRTTHIHIQKQEKAQTP